MEEIHNLFNLSIYGIESSIAITSPALQYGQVYIQTVAPLAFQLICTNVAYIMISD